MFNRHKTRQLVENIDRYFDGIDQTLLIFKDGVRNYLYSHGEEFDANLQSMVKIEAELTVLRREIENGLYTQTAMIRSKGDIMRLPAHPLRTEQQFHQAHGALDFSGRVRTSGRQGLFQDPRAHPREDQQGILL